MKTVNVKLTQKFHEYSITIQNDSIGNSGAWAKSSLPELTSKIAIISNTKVFGLYGKRVADSLAGAGYDVRVWLMEDGEEFKNLRSLENALKFFSESKMARTDAVIALGGGVAGDLAGLAAAVYLRGISFLQIPTTLLAMVDSSVGGKTAVNTEFGKNLIGAFFQPKAVLIDVGTLKSLETRELTAGFCEAIKQAAVSSEMLFEQTSEFLRDHPVASICDNLSDEALVSSLENLLTAQIAFKAEIVMQDEHEDLSRMDSKSRKILNFGHTFAHALEKVTDYKYFKHGEAVGYGILFAGELSKSLELLEQNRLNLLYDVVNRAGVRPSTDNINKDEVYAAFAFDKKVISESLQWVLLEDIGKPCIRRSLEIPRSAIEHALQKVLEV